MTNLTNKQQAISSFQSEQEQGLVDLKILTRNTTDVIEEDFCKEYNEISSNISSGKAVLLTFNDRG